MGKMDTSDLSERYFDENTILYSVSNRNEIIFGEKEEKTSQKEETITFTPGAGVTATVHGQNETSSENVVSDTDEETLVALWRMYKEGNPDGTLEAFYKDVLTTNSEVE